MASGKITRNDLISLLRDVEEYGRQHVFLYKTSKTNGLQLTNTNSSASNKRFRSGALSDHPPVLDRPNDLTLADVRVEPVQGGNRIVVKAVEMRLYRKFISEERHGNRITRIYEEIEDRAVNMVRLLPSGMLEMRIQTLECRAYYSNQIAQFWSLINPILPQLNFSLDRSRPQNSFCGLTEGL